MRDCVFAKTIYTGKSIARDSYLCFDEGKIVSVSKSRNGRLLDKFDTVTPAFIDPHSHIGMVRAGEPSGEEESNENMESILTLPDALDSIQMDDAAFTDAIEMGVLYSCVLPGSGNIVSGHSATIRNYAANSTDALITRSGVKAAFGYNPMSTGDWKGTRPSTRMGALALLRKHIDEIDQKIKKHRKAKGKDKDDITFSSEEMVVKDVLQGKTTLRAHVHKIDDIAALLRLVDEYNLKITVEHAMDVHQPEIYEELKRRRIPVTYGPIDTFAYKVELKHDNWRNIKHLLDSGVEFGLMSDHPVVPARQIFLQTRWFIRCGLSRQTAIELLSRKNAKLLGISKILGTLEKGKWASFVCYHSDPFDMVSYPVSVYGEGNLLFADR